jgi:hypothetical protein
MKIVVVKRFRLYFFVRINDNPNLIPIHASKFKEIPKVNDVLLLSDFVGPQNFNFSKS